MRLRAKGRWLDEALASMLRSNQIPAAIVRKHGATACTDVTGFGLAGHLLEMVRPLGLGARLAPDSIPVFAGARSTLDRGIVSSLAPANAKAAAPVHNLPSGALPPGLAALFDPQTSGGLLAAIPAENADACLAEFHEAGLASATIIGSITPAPNGSPALEIEG